jgi:hypothetical protein
MSEEPEKPEDQVALLLRFLRERDAFCPLCGYNLRNLVRPECPECQKDLELAVGMRKLKFGWFLATITPGLFSGIAAALLMIPMIGVPVRGGGAPPWFVVATDAFGWLSGIAALVLIKHRIRFLRQPYSVQRAWGVLAWAIHVGAFVVLLLTVLH